MTLTVEDFRRVQYLLGNNPYQIEIKSGMVSGIPYYTPAPAVPAPVVVEKKDTRTDEYYQQQREAVDAFLVLVTAQIRGLMHELFTSIISSIAQYECIQTSAGTELERLVEAFGYFHFLGDDAAEEARKFIINVFAKPRDDVDPKELTRLLGELSKAMRETILVSAQEDGDEREERVDETCERIF